MKKQKQKQKENEGEKEEKELRKKVPLKGEMYICEECGMSLTITAGCGCLWGGYVGFVCCDKGMRRL